MTTNGIFELFGRQATSASERFAEGRDLNEPTLVWFGAAGCPRLDLSAGEGGSR
jgi:hypothetical protein